MIDFSMDEMLELARQAELQKRVEADGVKAPEPTPVGLERVEGRESDDSFRRRLQSVATDPIDRERLWTVIGMDLDAIGLRYNEVRRPLTIYRERSSRD